MPKANFKRLIFILLSLTCIGLIGCSGPEEKKSSSLKEAAELRAAGKHEEALIALEALAEEYPNDPAILQQIGNIFDEQQDTTMAAFFLEQAHQQAPDDIELLYQTYQALEAANQPAEKLLEKLASQAPDAMTPELWLRLGKYRKAANQTQPALDAYLKGANPEISTPSAETAAAIGGLFIKADNMPQAERWLKIAADNDSPDALTALFGLLEIELRQKDWAGAETIMNRLDKQFPGAVDASEWSSARGELERWRQAQDAMRAELAKAEAAKKAAEKKAAAEKAAAAERAAAKKAAQQTVTAVAATPTTTSATTSATASASATAAEITEGKAQVIADMKAAESMAYTPAVEAVDADNSAGEAIQFNPSIAIEPAEPDLSFAVTYDQANNSITTYSVESTPALNPANPTLADTIQPLSYTPMVHTAQRPRSLDALMAEADQATVEHNYKLAITNYWQALGSASDRDDIWNLLSRAYLLDGQLKNAETTALESIRLAPGEIKYTLDYLRVAQRSKTPTEFLAELETAYDRFPRNPEVTLSLARGYERIAQNNASAATLYRRFIDLAPGHPLRPEAESAITRLR